jgi:hypothetical protein
VNAWKVFAGKLQTIVFQNIEKQKDVGGTPKNLF